jgi:tRNA modification GTPase
VHAGGGMSARDTIYALSSGPPPAGVAVIRMSGPNVRFGLETLIDSIPEPRRVSLRDVHDEHGASLDRGLVVFFPGPASFTGEDVAELHVHGGRAVVAAVLRRLGVLSGFRPAEAGEFTRRAFANQRLDLTQVEGLADLVAAETEAQRRQAMRLAEGAVGEAYERWRSGLVRARALIEAELDFPDEEDVPGSASEEAWALARSVRREIVNHVSDRRGELIRDGVEIVVLGPPNAGKSSLVNEIAGRDVAIVTPEPGTTRDVIEVRLDLGGYPVTLVDTAGLREAASAIEAEGVRRAGARAGQAELVLWPEEAGGPDGPPALPVPVLRIGTKADLIESEAERDRIHQQFDHLVSVKTGDGVAELLSAITARVGAELGGVESPLVIRERHRAALTACMEAIDTALVGDARPLELRAEDLRRAGDALGRVTGRIGVEDLLDVIFRDFCIGK